MTRWTGRPRRRARRQTPRRRSVRSCPRANAHGPGPVGRPPARARGHGPADHRPPRPGVRAHDGRAQGAPALRLPDAQRGHVPGVGARARSAWRPASSTSSSRATQWSCAATACSAARMLENVRAVGGVPVVVDDDWGTPVSWARSRPRWASTPRPRSWRSSRPRRPPGRTRTRRRSCGWRTNAAAWPSSTR